MSGKDIRVNFFNDNRRDPLGLLPHATNVMNYSFEVREKQVERRAAELQRDLKNHGMWNDVSHKEIKETAKQQIFREEGRVKPFGFI